MISSSTLRIYATANWPNTRNTLPQFLRESEGQVQARTEPGQLDWGGLEQGLQDGTTSNLEKGEHSETNRLQFTGLTQLKRDLSARSW